MELRSCASWESTLSDL